MRSIRLLLSFSPALSNLQKSDAHCTGGFPFTPGHRRFPRCTYLSESHPIRRCSHNCFAIPRGAGIGQGRRSFKRKAQLNLHPLRTSGCSPWQVLIPCFVSRFKRIPSSNRVRIPKVERVPMLSGNAFPFETDLALRGSPALPGRSEAARRS